MTNKRYKIKIILNIYDLHQCNGCLRCFGFGLFHCGVQLKYDQNIKRHSKEYSYLGNRFTESTGVFHCEPMNCYGAKYRTSLTLGNILISNRELSLILDRLRARYLAKDYDILTKCVDPRCILFHNK